MFELFLFDDPFFRNLNPHLHHRYDSMGFLHAKKLVAPRAIAVCFIVSDASASKHVSLKPGVP